MRRLITLFICGIFHLFPGGDPGTLLAQNAVCVDQVQLALGPVGEASLEPGDVDDGSTGFVSLSLDKSQFSCLDIGTTTVTLTATAAGGNTSQCTALLTVEDKLSPVAICNADLLILLDTLSSYSLTVAEINVGSSDNCGIDSMSLDQTLFDCSDLGAQAVTLSVWDESGNTSSCWTEVVVLGNNCNTSCSIQQQEVELAPGACTHSLALDTVGFDFISSSPALGTELPIGMHDISIFSDDGNGGVDTCIFTLTIQEADFVSLVCDALIQLTIAPGDSFELSPDIVLDGAFGCVDNYSLILETLSGDTLTGTTLDSSHWGDTLFAIVSHNSVPGSCWSTVIVKNGDCLLNGCEVEICAQTDLGQPICGVVLPNGISTDTSGCATLTLNGPTSVTPSKSDDYLNGLDLLDLVLIEYHVLAIIQLSPYQMIAADANGDGIVSTFDRVLFDQLLNGVTQMLPVPVWQFVPSDYVFPNPFNPFDPAFPQTETVDPSIQSETTWTGIKLGDINFSAPTGCDTSMMPMFAPVELQEAEMSMEDVLLNNGEAYVIPLEMLSSHSEVEGIQLNLNLDASAIELDSVVSNGLDGFSAADYSIDADGQLQIVWLADPLVLQNEGGIHLSSGSPLIELHVKSLTNSVLHKHLSIDTTHRSFLSTSQASAVSFFTLEIQNPIAVNVNAPTPFSVEAKVFPNPVRQMATIQVDSPERIGWTLVDALGKVVDRATFSGQYQFQRQGLPAGCYYYTLTTEQGRLQQGVLLLQ